MATSGLSNTTAHNRWRKAGDLIGNRRLATRTKTASAASSMLSWLNQPNSWLPSPFKAAFIAGLLFCARGLGPVPSGSPPTPRP